MKLHLPVCLYRALLSCLLIGFTIGAASFAFAEDSEEEELISLLSEEYPNGSVTYETSQTTELTLTEYESIFFMDIISSSFGGAIYNSGTSTLSNNGGVSFSGNKTSSSVFGGGAILNYGSRFMLNDNESVTFSGNSSAYNGGAIYNAGIGNFSLSKNGTVDFTRNTAPSGGAIYIDGAFTLSGNGRVTFSDNTASSSLGGGGAIYNKGTSALLNDNESVTFSGNSSAYRSGAICNDGTFSLSKNGTVAFTRNTAERGGAIYNDGTFSLSKNGTVTFSDNTAPSSFGGGAIYNDKNGTFTLNDNESVTFSGNSSAYRSGAIYNAGTLSLSGNGNVLFEKNAQIASNSCRLRSIFSIGTLFLSAAERKSILFRDSMYASGTANLNQDGMGDIIFSGASTEADLREVKGGIDGTENEILNSRTSIIATMTNLYGGRLIVEDKAVLKGQGITVAEGSGAMVRVKDGTLDHRGYELTFNSGTTLEAEGVSFVSASKVDMLAGSSLSFVVGEGNLTTAALTLTGALNTDTLSVSISGLDTLLEGRHEYALLSAESYDTSAWNADKITIAAEGVSFDDLSWKNGTLYLRYAIAPELTIATWNNASGDRKWNTSSQNWTQSGFEYAYSKGVEVVFGDNQAGTVTLEEVINPKSVLINNSEGHDYTFTGRGYLSGNTSLTKQGSGTLTINTKNFYNGDSIIEGGTVIVGNTGALGLGSISLKDATLILGVNSLTNKGVISTSGNSCIRVKDNCVYNLSYTIQNKGVLTIGGEFDVSKMQYSVLEDEFYVNTSGELSAGGFKKHALISVQVATGTIINDNAVIKRNGREYILGDDGYATFGGYVDYSVYYLTGDDTVSTSAILAKSPSVAVNISGGTLMVDTALPTIQHSAGGNLQFSARQSTGFSLSNCAKVEFKNISFEGQYPGGGALHNDGSSRLNANESVTFSNNRAVGNDFASGGAIYQDANSNMTINDNTSVTFSDNAAAYGGAVYVWHSTLQMSSNDAVLFSGNTATHGGGAISNDGNFSLSNNGSVIFRNNMVTDGSGGGAVYNWGTFKIQGNNDVLFEKNAEIQDGVYRLRSIYSTGNLYLDAPSGKSITFRDSIYASRETYDMAEVDHENLHWNSASFSSGSIIFTGASTEEDLWEVKGGIAGTDEEIRNSRTSELAAMVYLHRGRLIVEDKAILKGQGIKVTSGSSATVRVKDGTLDHSGYALTFNAGTTFEAEGVSSATASKVDMLAGSTLSFVVGEVNRTTAALTLTGALHTDALSVSIGGLEELGVGQYTYALLNASSYDTAAWTKDKITVKTEGVRFEDLAWDNGTLYLNYSKLPVLSTATWNNTSGEGVWDNSSANWTQEGYDYAYADGVDVFFGDTGAGTVTLEGDLAPKSVLVQNSAEADYVFTGEGKLTGATSLTKRGEGTLTITTDNDYTGGTNVEGGTLMVTGTLESDVAVSQGAELQLGGGHEVSVTAASGSETATLTGVSWSNGTLSGSDAETRGMLSGAHLHLAKDAVVTLENLELDATTRITDDPTTLLLKDVVSQQEAGGSLSEVGQDLLYVGTVLKENGSGTLLEPEEQATVTELVSSTFDSVFLSGTLLTLELQGYELTDFGFVDYISLTFNGGTADATIDEALRVLLTLDGEHYAEAYHLQGDATKVYFRTADAGAVPETSSATLSLLALVALAARRRRRK